MDEIFVKKVSPDRLKATIQVLNVEFIFRRRNDGDRIEIISKRKPDAQVHDPATCWVPTNLFNKACRMAAAILFSRQKQKTQTVLF